MNPSLVLATAKERRDIVEGLIPEKSVTWMYGASMSFKTFVAMSIAAAASRGADWMGRKTERCLVLYVGAEGGMSLHARRAGAELAAREAGDLCVATVRPMLDEREGQIRLRGMLAGLHPNLFDEPDNPAEAVVFNAAAEAYQTEDGKGFDDAPAVLVVIDTYSQTSGGDDKANVSAFLKGLRDMIEEAGEYRLSFLVIDHATKAGGSYVGSVAKLNDVDSQIEVVRDGQSLRATLHHRKVKDGIESEPVALELEQIGLVYEDAYGRELSTLVVKDGTRAAKIASVAEGKAGVVLRLLEDEGGRCEDDVLRRLFSAHASNEGIKAESVARAYKRAKENLIADGLVLEDGDQLRTT
jgi:hypothetical protein